MEKPALFVISLAALVIISGCLQNAGTGAPPQQPPVTTPPAPPSQPPAQPPPQYQYAISIASAPAAATAGAAIMISWRAETGGAQKTISHTGIHYDYSSHQGNFGTGVTHQQAGYASLTTEYASGSFTIPNTFTASVTPHEGTLYYRAHFVADGENYWTSERTIAVGAASPPVTVRYFTIDADDAGFYIGTAGTKVSSISVGKGDDVRITFNVRPAGVYYGGLDFRGCNATAASAMPGNSTAMRFTAQDPCIITSYWPSSGVAKDRLSVAVGGISPQASQPSPSAPSSSGGY